MDINTESYPVFKSKKTLQPCGEDSSVLGVEQAVYNVNLPALMSLYRTPETIGFSCEGEEYYFHVSQVSRLDDVMRAQKKKNITVTLILLNSPYLFDSMKEKALLDICIHPDFSWEDPDVFISAFPYFTEGRRYYQAFVEFLAKRYAGTDSNLSCVRGLIVSNEINSQYIWGNAGNKTPEEYVQEYEKILRLTAKASRKYYQNMRVYVSLDHLFNISLDPSLPLRYYQGRKVLELINEYAKREGNFDWSVAYHCYPENLYYPDFYNDRCAEFYFSTPRITFKNIEMLPAFLRQDRFLYQGRPRHIVLSEQGFHAEDNCFSEDQGAAAYALAYKKIEALTDIDMFMYHSYIDNEKEFGLHLGIRRIGDEGKPGKPRKIYYCMKAMGTDEESFWVSWARDFIGHELFDRLMHPVIHLEEKADESLNFGSRASDITERNG